MTTAESKKVKPPTRAALIRPILRTLPPAAFYLLFYLYLACEIDPRFLYNGGGLLDNFPTFYLDGEFWRRHLAFPGGLIEYTSAFLAQLFYYSWAGAAVVTCQAWLIGLGTDAYLKALGASRLRVLRFVGPLVLGAAYSQYTFHFAETWAFAVALSVTWLFLKFAPPQAARRILCFVVLSLVLYAAAGATYFLFALLCAGAQTVTEHRYRESLYYALTAAAVPYLVGVTAWGFPLLDAYTELLPLYLGTRENEPSRLMLKAVQVLYLFLPMTLAAVALGRATVGHRMSPSPRDGTQSGILRWALETILLAAATAATLFLYHDPGLRALFAVDYYSRQGMWSKVLEIARRAPPHYLICHAVNRALYHTHRLGDDMFAYYQDPNALLLTGKEALWQKADTFTDLGLLGEAEYDLTMLVKTFGERPLLLQRLAGLYLVKGDMDTALVYLQALRKVPFWRGQAREDLAYLRSDPNLTRAKEIQFLRAVRIKQDSVRPTDTLRQLLVENPKNRMAYEYGVAWLLLSRNLAGFLQTFNTYHNAIESRIPRHYEEALLLAQALNAGSADLGVRTVSPESVNRLASFMKARQPFGRDVAAARKALRERYGDSYYYYFFLGGPGVP